MLAQKDTIEKELAKLQVIGHTNYLPYHNYQNIVKPDKKDEEC